jgi:hypothetical protein
MVRYRQGKFNPKHPKKYVGDTKNIVYRSWLEFKFMSRLDTNPEVTKWASEEFFIPYRIPGENFTRRYFVDLFYEKTVNKISKKFIVEVKPYEQTKPPKQKAGKRKRYLTEAATYNMNAAKWKAAVKWGKERDCKFIIWTEKDLPDGGKTTRKRVSKNRKK